MEKPIRILHVLGTLNMGGAETMIMNLYRNIDREKIQFDFIIHTNKKCAYTEEIESLGGKIYSISKYNGKNHFKYKKEWNDFFKNHKEYKIIHGHMRSTASIYLSIAKKYGLKTIAHSHSIASRGNIIEKIIKGILQYKIRYIADYMFACSNEAGSWLFGKNVVDKKNYKIIKNAIETEKFLFNEEIRKHYREKLDLNDKFVIGHVGSFTEPKNHKFLIDIFYELQKQEKNARLLLIGDGKLKKIIQQKIKQLGIEEKVIFTGNVKNVNDYMQVMDIFVFPSIFEGLGIVAVEAQVSGLRCIVSDNIPKEAFMTNSIESISLKYNAIDWKNKILKYDENYERLNNYNKIRNYNYDIKGNVVILEKLYLNMLGGGLDV